MANVNVMFFHVLLVLTLAVLTLSTPVPAPGPACAGGTPVVNQSGPIPDCPGKLQVHNASCDARVVWEKRALFHAGSECHGENDPNGLFEYRGVYHVFFQDHVTATTGGHLATTDFVHWKRLPIAIWNDHWYDKAAIWTFSATIVNDVPHIIYPGIAGPNASLGDCGHGPTGAGCFTHAMVTPANLSDPWLVDWVKPDFNPIIGNISIRNRDPTTAWQTASGEWRYMDAVANMYSSWDFRSWVKMGALPSFGTGDCPDFFPVPRVCDGCSRPSQSPRLQHALSPPPPPQPTHVREGGFQAVYALGTYTDGAANTTGNWTAVVDGVPMDLGGPQNIYAAKTMEDSKGRRIWWAWIKLESTFLEYFDENNVPYPGFKSGGCHGIGNLMTNTNSLPREVSFDPTLMSLVYFPLVELSALRGRVLGTIARPTLVKAGKDLVVANTGAAQSEARVTFAMPTACTTLGLRLLTGTGGNQGLLRGSQGSTVSVAVNIRIDFCPNTHNDDLWNVSVGYDLGLMQCPNYTHHGSPPGIHDRIPCPSNIATMALKKDDTGLEIAVWSDNLFAEVFFMGGRASFLVPFPCDTIVHGKGLSVFSTTSPATLQNATSWSMKPIHFENEGPSDNRT